MIWCCIVRLVVGSSVPGWILGVGRCFQSAVASSSKNLKVDVHRFRFVIDQQLIWLRWLPIQVGVPHIQLAVACLTDVHLKKMVAGVTPLCWLLCPSSLVFPWPQRSGGVEISDRRSHESWEGDVLFWTWPSLRWRQWSWPILLALEPVWSLGAEHLLGEPLGRLSWENHGKHGSSFGLYQKTFREQFLRYIFEGKNI